MSSSERPATPIGNRSTKADAFTTAVEKPKELIGRVRPKFDARKYTKVPKPTADAGLSISVTRDDRLPVAEARELLEDIHRKILGVDGSTKMASIIERFDEALWFCHTVNSASTLVPGRSTFTVPGSTVDFSYMEVLSILGVNARRFFRTYADDIAMVNRRVLSAYDPSDPVAVENWSWLMDVATTKGLSRFPHLAHDSADACLLLNMSERAALAESKVLVIGSTVNVADTMKANNRVQSVPPPRYR